MDEGRTATVALGVAVGIIGFVGWNVWLRYGGWYAFACIIGMVLLWFAVCKTAAWFADR
jgi:hypothetical protein